RQIEPLLAGRGRQHLVALELQVVLQDEPQIGLVLYRQDSWNHLPPSLIVLLHVASGSVIVNTLPCPCSLCTSIVPPCATTVERTIARPRPKPRRVGPSTRP